MADGEQHRSEPTPERGGRAAHPVDRRAFLKGAGVLGAATLAAPFLPREPKAWSLVRGAGSAVPSTPIEHVIVSCQETARSTTTSGTRRLSAPTGRRPATRSPTGPGAASSRTGSRTCRPRTCRTRGAPSTSSGTAGPWTASTPTPASGPWATTRPTSCPSTTVRRVHAVRQLLLLAAGTDVAQPVLSGRRHVGGDHHQRRLGLRRLRLPDRS